MLLDVSLHDVEEHHWHGSRGADWPGLILYVLQFSGDLSAVEILKCKLKDKMFSALSVAMEFS